MVCRVRVARAVLRSRRWGARQLGSATDDGMCIRLPDAVQHERGEISYESVEKNSATRRGGAARINNEVNQL